VLVAREQARLLASLDDDNARLVAAALEPFVTPERAARLRATLDARLDSLTVLMDAPHDPHNGAAVLRSCDAFGVQRLHVVERLEPFLTSRKVARGSQRWVDVRTYASSADAIAALRASGHRLLATHPDGALTPRDLASIPRLAIVLGNERDGIHPEIRDACEGAVRVPMRGFAESLNVSVSAAILLEHAAHGRPGDLPDGERSRLYARALSLTVPRAPEILAAKGIAIGSFESDLDAPTAAA
jgi:tRNA (guanosine-2'-O-)-methyltransferase